MVLKKLLNDDPISFYWMGFILADGWLSSRVDTNNYKVNHLGISLKREDDEHIKKLITWLGVSDVVRYRKRDTNYTTDAESSDICITDHHTVPLLKEKFDVSNRKTYNPPNMNRYNFPSHLFMSLIIGFIDGDGSINMRGSHKPHISIQTTHEWKDNLELINKFIHEFVGESVRNKVIINSRGHASLSICKRYVVAKLFDFIQDYDLPVMHRKWSIIDRDKILEDVEIDNGVRYSFKNLNTGELVDNIKSLNKFCISNNLNAHKFNSIVLNGGGICDGWEVLVTSPLKRKPREGKKHILEKDGIIYTTTNLKDFCRRNNLEYHKMIKLCNGVGNYAEWKVKNA